MKNVFRVVTLTLCSLLLVAAAAVAKPPHAKKAKWFRAGEAFCPNYALIAPGDGVVIHERCYTLALVRMGDSSYLAFLDPEVRIPPGQLVRLNTPAGAKLKGRILYLVPVHPKVIIPSNTVVVVPVRVEDEGSRLTVVLSTPGDPSLTVVFSTRL